MGFRWGSSGVPRGFRGGLSGFRVISIPCFTRVPVSATAPYIILIGGKGWESEAGRDGRSKERGGEGIGKV